MSLWRFASSLHRVFKLLQNAPAQNGSSLYPPEYLYPFSQPQDPPKYEMDAEVRFKSFEQQLIFYLDQLRDIERNVRRNLLNPRSFISTWLNNCPHKYR